MKDYLKFTPYQIKKRKTINVEVRNLKGELLGEIEWSTSWRKYVFVTIYNGVTSYNGIQFDYLCLRQLSNYLNSLMEERKKKKRGPGFEPGSPK